MNMLCCIVYDMIPLAFFLSFKSVLRIFTSDTLIYYTSLSHQFNIIFVKLSLFTRYKTAGLKPVDLTAFF